MDQARGRGATGQSEPDDHPLSDALRRAAAALRIATGDALRPFQLTVIQFTCLDLLRRRPGATNAELARDAFVRPESMNAVLLGLERRGLVVRPDAARNGRARPAHLTAAGTSLLQRAVPVTLAVELQLHAALSVTASHHLLRALHRCADALETPTSAAEDLP